MISITRFFGVLAVVGGVTCAVIAAAAWSVNALPDMRMVLFLAGIAGIVQGALIYCVAEIAASSSATAEHLIALTQKAPRSGGADLDRMKGVFAER